MDFFTFLKSSTVLVFPMAFCAQIGMDEDDVQLILPKIRNIGIDAEQKMFEATSGINTQKGLIFLESIISSAAGYLLKKNKSLTSTDIARTVSDICLNIIEIDMKGLHIKRHLTRGERFYIEYGFTGIRGEVAKGLPTVLKYGLPALYEAKLANLNDNDCMIHVLISVMQVTEDTNILGRHSMKVLNDVKDRAGEIIDKGGMTTSEGRDMISDMDKIFVSEGISPGGAVDIAAVTFFIYLLIQQFTGDI